MTIHIMDVINFVLGVFAWLAIGLAGVLFFSYPKDIEVKYCVGGFSVSTVILLLVVGTAKGYIRWQL